MTLGLNFITIELNVVEPPPVVTRSSGQHLTSYLPLSRPIQYANSAANYFLLKSKTLFKRF